MIFVTVGTHEQQFNRLIKEVDRLKEIGIIKEDVFIQTGYSDYEPKYCEWSKFVKYEGMKNYIENARIVICHGGPASFLSVLEQRKSPIVVPRKFSFEEHINDHQLEFSRKIQSLGYKIYVVDDIEELESNILNFKNNKGSFKTNNEDFTSKLNDIINNLVGDTK